MEDINATTETLETLEDTLPVTEDDVNVEFGAEAEAEAEAETGAGTEAEEINSTLAAAMAAEIGGEPEAPKVKGKVGPKNIFEKDGAVESALLAIYAGAAKEGEEMPSRFIEKKLAEAGLVYFEPVKVPGAAGRPRHVAYLTSSGLSRIGLTG